MMLLAEVNAVRYASGYVAMKLTNEFEKLEGGKAAQFKVLHMVNNGDDSSFLPVHFRMDQEP